MSNEDKIRKADELLQRSKETAEEILLIMDEFREDLRVGEIPEKTMIYWVSLINEAKALYEATIQDCKAATEYLEGIDGEEVQQRRKDIKTLVEHMEQSAKYHGEMLGILKQGSDTPKTVREELVQVATQWKETLK